MVRVNVYVIVCLLESTVAAALEKVGTTSAWQDVSAVPGAISPSGKDAPQEIVRFVVAGVTTSCQ